jgi:hypothetical protein
MRNAYSILVGNLGGNRPVGRPKHRWENNIRIGWEGLDWMNVAQDRALVNIILKLRVQQNVGNFLISCIAIRF